MAKNYQDAIRFDLSRKLSSDWTKQLLSTLDLARRAGLDSTHLLAVFAGAHLDLFAVLVGTMAVVTASDAEAMADEIIDSLREMITALKEGGRLDALVRKMTEKYMKGS